MNLRLVAAAFLCLAAGFSAPAFASDPCEIVLCMYGKAIGASQSECNSAVKNFFSLNSFISLSGYITLRFLLSLKVTLVE